MTQLSQTTRLLSTMGFPPKIFSALTRAGFESLDDMIGMSEAELLEELGLKMDVELPDSIRAVLSSSSAASSDPPDTEPRNMNPPPIPSQFSILSQKTQISSFIGSNGLNNPEYYRTPSSKLNELLASSSTAGAKRSGDAFYPSEGGLKSGYVLEISGPPGSGRSSLALEFVRAAAEKGQEVLVVDSQSSMSPGRISSALDGSKPSRSHPSSPQSAAPEPKRPPSNLVFYAPAPNLYQLMALIHTLPSYLEANPKIRFILFSSLSSVFQPTTTFNVSGQQRSTIMETIKQNLAKVCLQNGITVVVTNQMSTRLLGPDGASANFENGVRAIMKSQLGNEFLSPSRSYRITLYRDLAGVRYAKLDSSPAIAVARKQTGRNKESVLRSSALKAPFEIDSQGRVRDVA